MSGPTSRRYADARPLVEGACAVIRHHHVALSVASMERAVEWYCAAFGFDVEMAFELPGFRATMLVTTDGMKIELFEADDSTRTTDSSDPRTVMRSQGFTHLALGVDDLDAVHARLLELGARTVWPPQDSPEPGQRMAFIHDPEGNLIELIGSA